MPLNIFYIDDEEALCEIFVDFFASKDVNIFTFTDPDKAYEMLKDISPDILFIDYRLGNVTGDEVAKKFDPKIPKYLISGDLTVHAKFTFDKVFSKPYDPVVIGDLILSSLSKL